MDDTLRYSASNSDTSCLHIMGLCRRVATIVYSAERGNTIHLQMCCTVTLKMADNEDHFKAVVKALLSMPILL